MYINNFMEKLIKEMKIGPNEGIRLQDSLIGLLAYADDVDIYGRVSG